MNNNYRFHRLVVLGALLLGSLVSCRKVSIDSLADRATNRAVTSGKSEGGENPLQIKHIFKWIDRDAESRKGSIFYTDVNGERQYFLSNKSYNYDQYPPFPTNKGSNEEWSYVRNFSPTLLIRDWFDNRGKKGDLYYYSPGSLYGARYYYVLRKNLDGGKVPQRPFKLHEDDENWFFLLEANEAFDKIKSLPFRHLALYPWHDNDGGATLGSIYYYDNPYSSTKEREYFLLTNRDKDGVSYRSFPTDRSSNRNWLYLGTDASLMNSLKAYLKLRGLQVKVISSSGTGNGENGDWYYADEAGQRKFYIKTKADGGKTPDGSGSWDEMKGFPGRFSIPQDECSPAVVSRSVRNALPKITVHEWGERIIVGNIYYTGSFREHIFYKQLQWVPGYQNNGQANMPGVRPKISNYSADQIWERLDFSKEKNMAIYINAKVSSETYIPIPIIDRRRRNAEDNLMEIYNIYTDLLKKIEALNFYNNRITITSNLEHNEDPIEIYRAALILLRRELVTFSQARTQANWTNLRETIVDLQNHLQNTQIRFSQNSADDSEDEGFDIDAENDAIREDAVILQENFNQVAARFSSIIEILPNDPPQGPANWAAIAANGSFFGTDLGGCWIRM